MKQFLLIILSFFLCSSTLFAQDFWEEIIKPVNSPILALTVNDTNTVFVGFSNYMGVYSYYPDNQQWQNTEMENNSAYSLFASKNGDVFAGTGGFFNIYKMHTIEEGWMPIFSCSSNIVVFGSDSHENIYAGSGYMNGLYKSTDNGEEWINCLTLEENEQSTSIIAKDSNTIFLGSIDFMGIKGGVYRSVNNGNSWVHVGLRYEYISSLAINSEGVIFAGSRGNQTEGGGGVFKSEDNGNTWIELTGAIWVTSMVIDTNDVIYVGAEINSGQGGVFRSVDNGLTWERIISGMGQYPSVEGMCLSPDGYLYAYDSKLYRSVNPLYTDISDKKIKINNFKITPNPATDFLTLHTTLKDYTIQIADVTGRVVYSKYKSTEKSLNVASLNSGIYVLTVIGDNCSISHKFVKQ